MAEEGGAGWVRLRRAAEGLASAHKRYRALKEELEKAVRSGLEALKGALRPLEEVRAESFMNARLVEVHLGGSKKITISAWNGVSVALHEGGRARVLRLSAAERASLGDAMKVLAAVIDNADRVAEAMEREARRYEEEARALKEVAEKMRRFAAWMKLAGEG